MPGAMKWASRIGVGATNPVTTQIEFTGESLKINQILSDLSGTRGTLWHPDARVRETERKVDGGFECQPVPAELDALLPFILGGTKVDNVTPMAPTPPLPAFYITKDCDTAGVFTYSGCKVSKATFSANANGPMKLALDIMGIDETKANAGTFPTLSPIEDQPYIMSDCVMLIAGTAYPIDNMSLVIDNGLSPKMVNSLTPTRINPTDLSVTWGLSLPAGDAIAIYGASALSAVACQATFTNGSKNVIFRSELVRAPKETPQAGDGRDEIDLTWNGVARGSAAQPSVIKITNKSS